MLVLSRKAGESLLIGQGLLGEGIQVTVVAVQGNRVRLGITAPAEVSIRRQEIVLDLPEVEHLSGSCDLGIESHSRTPELV
ncbi:carbon storage regulator [Planctopirus limnophila DSM 3776]|uniref:Translational regulator CsrA n=1 Tax=Planctopirus limnophila (strain ATCC 43296 / DSM 3776 / IFAM 1008 / Mu 290) TaxID=521674 RepID=D5SUV4_PLAL2|nr:carbon storage regulator [Planctopirus limnophila]ADG69240.1 carbon storage regulator [Planctopirus limnophila DSM 3776]